MAFNRDRNSRSGDSPRFAGGAGRGGFRPRPSFGDRPRFNDRGDRGNDRGPVEMHSAVCDNCGKSCEVPFRPTSGKPVYCSNCFESKREGSDSRSSGYERRSPERPDNGLAEINTKLDNILKLLESQKPVVKEKKPAKIKEIETIEAIEEQPAPIIEE